MLTRKIWVKIGKMAIVLIFALGIGLGCFFLVPNFNPFFFSLKGIINKEESNKSELPLSMKKKINEEAVIHLSDPVTLADCLIEWIFYYQKCHHTNTVVLPIDSEDIGLTQNEYRERHPGSFMLSFTPSKLILQKNVEHYCPQHYILMKNDDSIGVYKTDEKSGSLMLYEQFDILFQEINDEVKVNIEDGIAFDSLEDVEEFLENLDS